MKGWGKAITFKFTCKQKRLVFLHKIFGNFWFKKLLQKVLKQLKKQIKKANKDVCK